MSFSPCDNCCQTSSVKASADTNQRAAGGVQRATYEHGERTVPARRLVVVGIHTSTSLCKTPPTADIYFSFVCKITTTKIAQETHVVIASGRLTHSRAPRKGLATLSARSRHRRYASLLRRRSCISAASMLVCA